jgi:hypothetical protein
LLTGCYSFNEIPKEEYENIVQMNDIKIVYKNGKEFVVEKDDTTSVKMIGDSLIVYQGTNTKSIEISEVEKIKESRFDLGGTLIGIVVCIIVFGGAILWAMGFNFQFE